MDLIPCRRTADPVSQENLDTCMQGRGEDLWAPGESEAWASGKASCERYTEGVHAHLRCTRVRGSGGVLPRENFKNQGN